MTGSRFTGVSTYRDPLGRFAFRYPSDWHRFAPAGEAEGVLFSPQEAHPTTYVGAWVRALDTRVVAGDLELLRDGLDAGLERLPECRVETAREDALGDLVKLERVVTFADGAATRKRRLWVLYADTWQIMLLWQGGSPEQYADWLPQGNYAFATFELPHALWFATDQDVGAGDELPDDLRQRAGS